MEQQSKQNIKLNEIRIGILGFSGSGKTSYQAALSYFLHYRTDEEIQSGEPLGKKPRKYLDKLIEDIRKNKIPDKTQSSESLTYRLKFKNDEFLLTTCDYNGDDLANLINDNVKQNQKLADFFRQCDAFLIFISSEEMINKNREKLIDEMQSYIDFIQLLKSEKQNQKRNVNVPTVLCITKSDIVRKSDESKLDCYKASLKLISNKLNEQVSKHKIIDLSSINPQLNKDSVFQCSNVLKPIKSIIEYYNEARNRYKIVKAVSIILPVIVILCIAILQLNSTATRKFNEFQKSINNIESLSDEDLEIKKFEIEDLYNEIGFYQLLIPHDIEKLKESSLYKILKIQEHRTQTTSMNSVESYENSFDRANDVEIFKDEADKNLLSLRKSQLLQRWYEISIHQEQNPGDFENINNLIIKFIEDCPFQIIRQFDPSPESMLAENTDKWDRHEWKKIVDFETDNVISNSGSIQNITSLIKMMKDYLELFEKPIYKVNASKLIELYTKISVTNKYKVILTRADYKGGIEDFEKNPDIYIKVFVNDVLQYDSSEIVKTDERNPVWNAEFTINWKAYDNVILEIWDKNLINDDLLCKLNRNNFSSAYTIFRNIYYPSKAKWKLRVSFNWLGPKR